MRRLEINILAGLAGHMSHSLLHIEIMEQRSGGCIEASVFDRFQNTSVGKFFRLYHDKAAQIMFPDIVGIVGGKAENLIFHKQKVVKIRLGIAIVS